MGNAGVVRNRKLVYISHTMLLADKRAVIYGAGGSLGGAVAKAFAEAGARVFLTGRHKTSLQKVADSIGGEVSVDVVDGFDEHGIAEHLKKVGNLDISFNAVGVDLRQGVPLIDLSMEEVVEPVTRTLQTRFLTARAAAQVMIPRRSGVILSLTATPGGIGYPLTAGFAMACAAVERFSSNLAAEIGPHGIRVVNIRSGGSPDSKVFADAIANQPEVMAGVLRQMEADTMLKRQPPMADIAHTAVFLASSLAAGITGVTVDVTCGTTAGLNYRAHSPEYAVLPNKKK